jgi:hypothetical protein
VTERLLVGGNEPDRLVDLGLRSDDRRGDARDYDVRWPGLVHAQHRRNQLVIRWASSGFGGVFGRRAPRLGEFAGSFAPRAGAAHCGW